MQTYREAVQSAKEKKIAVGHFNISNIEGLWAIVKTAKELNVSVLIGASEGERDFIGVWQCVALVKSIREELDYPVYLNADHTYSFERVKEAIDAGFDSVIFDGAKLPFNENVTITKQCVDYARASGRDVIVEGELGYIGSGSVVLDKIPEGVGLSPENLTSPEQAKEFVEKTGVDFFAPAIGNIHGMLRDTPDPKLDNERVSAIAAVTGVPLVLHGASGNTAEDVRAVIKAGISIVHINTEIRRAWKEGVEKHLREHPDDVAPYKIGKSGAEAMAKVVKEKLELFSQL